MDSRIKDAHVIIDDALARFHTDQMYAAFSGGHDSLTAAHVASQHPAFKGIIHLDTTIGIPETRQFVNETCDRHGWPLHVGKPAKYHGYVQMVLRYGFPGPSQHSIYYNSLKNRPLSTLVAKLRQRPGQNIVLATGMRRQESSRRMRVTETIRAEKNLIWTSHIFNWTALDVAAYIQDQNLPRNPVKDTLHISGECLCGCFADTGERQDIATWFPHVNAEILKIERLLEFTSSLKLQDYSYPAHTGRWGWGAGNKLEEVVDQDPLPMCHFCTYDRYDKLAEKGHNPLFDLRIVDRIADQIVGVR
jgi:3'-phosphoadenosine 5'-phosphosulfate sulfotransferase (PAPS reductase)/FAD synthetase